MKKTAVGLGALAFVLLIYLVIILKSGGFFSSVTPKGYGYCERIANVVGPEDLVFLPDHSRVVISSNPRHNYKKNTLGHLYLYDPATFKVSGGMASINFPFYPHGMDLFENGSEILLYVVNQRGLETTTVEVFKYNGRVFTHQRTLESPLFQSGNDILVTEEDQFFMTSHFNSPSEVSQKLSILLRNATGYVSYFDGQRAHVAADDIFFANGLARYGDKLFVGATLENAIRVFKITPEGLWPDKTIEVDGGPDNIYYEDGALYVATHPKIFSLINMISDRKEKSPSRVLAITSWAEGKIEKNILYENAGSELAASSVALPLANDRILMGSVFDNHLLDCSLR